MRDSDRVRLDEDVKMIDAILTRIKGLCLDDASAFEINHYTELLHNEVSRINNRMVKYMEDEL